MARKQFYAVLLHREGEPSWFRIQEGKVYETDRTQVSSRAPFIAVLPNDFFYFFLPPDTAVLQSERKQRAALKLHMQHFFPASNGGDLEMGALSPTGGTVLGYAAHPRLRELWEQHRSLLRKAKSVTTPFLMAWVAARQRRLETWILEDGNGPTCICNEGRLLYFCGTNQEKQNRLEYLGLEQKPHSFGISDLLTEIDTQQIKWGQIRLPFPKFEHSETQFKGLGVVAGLIALLGLFFCLGQGFRLMEVKNELSHWENRLHSVYEQALNGQVGNDPYGQLLAKADELQDSQGEGIRILDLWAIFSKTAPEGFEVQTMSLKPEDGVVTGKLRSYDQLEVFLEQLRQDKNYNFQLQKASNAKQGIKVTFKVTY